MKIFASRLLVFPLFASVAHVRGLQRDNDNYQDDKARNLKGPKSKSSKGIEPDALCIDYCDRYLKTCFAANAFYNPVSTLGAPNRKLTAEAEDRHRELIAGSEPAIQRIRSKGIFKVQDDCLSTCMRYPRPMDPSEYTNPEDFGVNLGSDTIWCRFRHMSLAENAAPYEATFHCPHAGPAGGGICRDSLVDGATPFDHLRAGASTARHLGYCDLAAKDTVAECTKAGITDSTLPTALRLLPDTVKILILNNNLNITELPSGIFDNLRNPSGIKALIMEDCSIETLAADAFTPLENLVVLNLNQNLIADLPDALFQNNIKLKQFSMFHAGSKPGLLSELPEDLFSTTPNMERIVIYGHANLDKFPANIFKGLTKVEAISFVDCGFTNTGFPDGVFDDLVSLKFFDFFGNKLDKVDAAWFKAGWGTNILRLALNGNPIVSIDADAFETLDSVENVYLHGTDLEDIPDGVFDGNNRENEKLIAYTLS